MKDKDKTKDQLIKELISFRQQVPQPNKPKMEPRQEEQTFQKSDFFYQTFFDLAPDPMAITDFGNGRIFNVNQAFITWSHYSREELIGHTTAELGFWVDNETREKVLEQLNNTDFVGDVEVQLKIKGGESRYIIFSGKLIEIDNRKWFFSLARDITGRKKIEEALQQSEAKYRSIFDNAVEGIFQTTPDGCFINANQTLARMLGFASPEEMSASITNIGEQLYVNPEERIEHLRIIVEKGSLQGYEIQLRRKDGSILWTSINTYIVKDADGTVHHYEGMIEDITSRKKVEELNRIRLALFEFSATHSLEELLQKTLDEVGELTESPIGFYHFVGSDQETLTLQAWSTRTVKEFCKAEGKGLHYPIDRAGVWVDCVRERRPVIHNDYSALPHRKGMPEGHAQVHRELVVPIMRSGKIVAIMGIGNKLREYTDEDIETVSYLADIAWNITERKRTEEELRASEKKYRSVIENIQDVFYRSDTRGLLLMGSPSGAKLFGYDSVDEMIGLPLDSFWPDTIERQKLLDQVRTTGIANDFEAVLKKKDGTLFNASFTTRFYYDEQGNFLGTEGIIRDITDHKKIEETLKESEERYRTAIENSNDGVAIMKGNQHLYVNKKFLEIFGYTDSMEVIGQTVSLVVHPDDLDRVSGINSKRQVGKPVPSQYEFKGIKKNGAHVYIEVSAAKTTFLGEIVSLVYLRDITERRRLESQLLQAQKMEAIGTLAGGVAHDFNNILTALIGYGNLIQMKMDKDDPLRVYVDQILASSERAANLTQSLLAFSRKQVITLRPCKVNNVIKEIEKLLKRLLTEDIELKVILADNDLTLMADITQMDQVLMNLAINARDAMPKGGTLTLEVQEVTLDDTSNIDHDNSKPGTYALISASDTGIGMDKSTQERIFDPFFTTKEVGKGTGLGLSTVYGIIKQHNGYISVESTPGQGTTFRIYLPVVTAQTREKEPTPLPTQGGTETILIAEDNVVVRNLTKEILTMAGYRVIEAVDGEDAIQRFMKDKDTIALMIFDVVMPKKNGKEAYEEIRKVHPNIKVIFASGYTGDVILEKGIRDDTVDFIKKPLLPDELLLKVRTVLDK